MADTNGSRKTKVFISYSRQNKLFVRKLNKAIDEGGIESWVDWEGIPPSADWMEEITNAIKSSDAFLFVLSPDSLKSRVCANELELAIQFNKKIIPILYGDPEEKQEMHPKLASHNWVYMRPRKDDFKAALPKLIGSIQIDLGWVQQHTRLLQRATEWEHKDRNRSYLLQGSDLNDAERWMIESTKDAARVVTPAQAEYINTSRKEAVRRQRNLTIGIGFAMALSILLGILAVIQWRSAEQSAVQAKNSAATAIASGYAAATQQARAEDSETRARENENKAMSQRSAMQAGIYGGRPGELDTSTLLALESWQRLPSNDAENILRTNLSRMPIPVTQMRQNGRISGISTSADGKYFVTASDDGTACVWTLYGKQEYCVQHNGVVNDAMFSADGGYLVTAGTDGVVSIWDGKSETPVKSFEYKVNVWDIDISKDNKWLAAGRGDGKITLINLAKLKEELTFDLSSGEIYTLAFSANAEWLALGLTNGQITLWRVNTGDSKAGPKHNAGIQKVKFSPDGNWLVSVGPDNTARVARTISGGTKYILPHDDRVEDVAFSPDSSWFVTASDDRLLRVFSTETGREKFRMEHGGAVSKVEVSPNGQWIAATGLEGRVLVWDALSGGLVQEVILNVPGTAIAFSTDNTRLLVGDREGHISIWNISNLGSRAGYIEFPELIHKAKYSYTGEWVLFNTDDRNLWVIPSKELTTLHNGRQGQKLVALKTVANQTKVGPDSKWIAFTENEGHTANLYNIETAVRHILPHESNVTDIGFSGDGKLFATTREKGTSVYIWDVESGQQVEEIKLNETAYTIAFNPLDTTLAIGLGGKFLIWDMAGKKELASFEQVGNLKLLTFSRDGHWLATTSTAGGISIWDMSNGLPILPTYTFVKGGSITSLDFNAGGKLFASGGSNGYVYIWDLTEGEERARLPHKTSVGGVSFSPVSNQLITVSEKVAQVWDLSHLEFIATEKLEETACSRLTENLSTNSWRVFFQDEDYRLICPDLPVGEN